MLIKAGELIWKAGPLTKGPNLCHGTAGNGYAFLKLYRRTGDTKWLERARAFATHAIDQSERHAHDFGQRRYSLWTGDLGLAVYLSDCINGVAHFQPWMFSDARSGRLTTMKYHAVIFDLFGTIVEGFAAASAGSNHAEFPAALGVAYDPFMQHWRQLTDRRSLGEFQTIEASIEHVCNIIGATVTAEQMTKAVEIRLQLTRRALTPRADAVTTLAQLKNDGFKIGLLSNCSIEIPMVWPETEFADCFMPQSYPAGSGSRNLPAKSISSPANASASNLKNASTSPTEKTTN